jgi:hypothetical protein
LYHIGGWERKRKEAGSGARNKALAEIFCP